MIYLKKQNVVYVRGRKTGSTSIELGLSTLAEDMDVVTPVCQRDEELREVHGGRPPQNFELLSGKLTNHSSIAEFYSMFPTASPLSFTVDRDPWEKVVSLWFHRYKDPSSRPTMDQFIDSSEAFDAYNWPLYTIDGEVAVDFVLRYENLSEELDKLATNLGWVDFPALPKAKSQFRTDRRSSREILTDSQAERIAEHYKHEISGNGYGWEK